MSTVTMADVTAERELEQLFKEHYQFVYRTAHGITGNSEDAEDILQNIFMGLVRREFPPDLLRNPRAYLYRAAFNLSLNVIRDRKRRPSSEDSETMDSIPAERNSGADDEELEKRLHEAIAALHPGASQIVLLRYIHDYSIADIAKLMSTSRSVVAVTLFRARARLKHILKAMEQRL
jgi:RNA polymerase sigma-70 factor, ECF subfamily